MSKARHHFIGRKYIYLLIIPLLITLFGSVIYYYRYRLLMILIFLFLKCIGPFGYSVFSNDIVKSIDSPDGKYTAIAFIRNGGATTSFSPQVSILKKGKKLGNTEGNIFVGYHSEFIDIIWKDSNTLVITYDCLEKDIFKQEKNKDGVNIIYQIGR